MAAAQRAVLLLGLLACVAGANAGVTCEALPRTPLPVHAASMQGYPCPPHQLNHHLQPPNRDPPAQSATGT